MASVAVVGLSVLDVAVTSFAGKTTAPSLLPREMKIEQGPKEIIKREAEVSYYPLTTQAITKYYTR